MINQSEFSDIQLQHASCISCSLMAGSPIEGVGIEVPPSDCARDIVAHLSTLILISLKSISLSAERDIHGVLGRSCQQCVVLLVICSFPQSMQELFISANNLGIKEEASIRVGNGEGAV